MKIMQFFNILRLPFSESNFLIKLENFHQFWCVSKVFDSEITSFGGIHLIHEQLSIHSAIDFIDNQLSAGVRTFVYTTCAYC